VSTSPHPRMETGRVSETSWFLVFRIPADRRSPRTQWFWKGNVAFYLKGLTFGNVFFSFWGLCETESPLGTSANIWPVYQPRMMDDRVWSSRWNDCQGKPNYWEKTSPSTTLSTTNPTWSDRASTWAAVEGSQRLTASAMERPSARN
jgi:hypothetical protein